MESSFLGSSAAASRFADLSQRADSRSSTNGAGTAPQLASAAGGSNGMYQFSSRNRVSLVVLNTPEVLSKLETLLGIDGKKIKVPSIMGRPSVDVPWLYLIFVGLLVYMGGAKAVLPILAMGYFIASSR